MKKPFWLRARQRSHDLHYKFCWATGICMSCHIRPNKGLLFCPKCNPTLPE